jgi:hypothetical protein
VLQLSALFKLPWKRSAPRIAGMPDRRGDERYEAYQPVMIRMPGMPPVTGTLISISLGGAAIRFHGWIAEVPEPWLTELSRGDGVQLEGLIDAPTSCQIVTTQAGVLRVQFAQDDGLRRKLRAMVSDFTGTRLTARMSGRTRPGPKGARSMTDRSAVELRAQAAEYRELATGVRTEAAADTLVRLATAFEALAARKEARLDTV